ncbi:hypothetical protein ACIP10_15470 [Streptomyces galbus]|uniref:hypothetical protein n=1 Tax=Streptomyces galbus TaxID=33898 RepID=UPI0037BD4931
MTPRRSAREEIIKMLRAGRPYAEIRAELGVALSTIREARRACGLPPGRPGRRPRDVETALAQYSEPYGDGHVRWTGPRSGTYPQLCVGGGISAVPTTAFRVHHRRPAEGRITSTCGEPDCVAGAHLADRTMRQRLDRTYTAIFGPDAP